MRVMAVFFLFFATVLSGQEQGTQIRVVTEEWKPFNYTNHDGKLTGEATERVRAVLNDAGLSYSIASYPWKRSMALARSQENVLIYSIYRTEERLADFHWVCPLLPKVDAYLYKLSERNDINPQNLDEIKNYTVTATRESVVYDYLLGLGFKPGVNLDLSPDAKVGFRKLLGGRVDLLLRSEPEMKHALDALDLDYSTVTKVFKTNAGVTENACMAFSLKTRPEIVEKVRHALDRYNIKTGFHNDMGEGK